jgi:hypothetical protein
VAAAAVHRTLILGALALSAACALEPGTTRQRAGEELGLAAQPTASLRLQGEPSYDGAARAGCGPLAVGAGRGFRVRLAPEAAPATEVVVVVPRFAGFGDHRGELTVRRLAADGAVVESAGAAAIRIARATDAAGAHAASGAVSGRYDGAAGAGELTAAFERCFYFG